MLARELRLLLSALQFLTRLPMPVAWAGHDTAPSSRAVRQLPLAGAVIGASAAAVALLAQAFWSDLVAAALSVGFTAWLTAALHEDGLADTCDALMGAASREKALAIMKDSLIGSYGAVALGLVLLLRVLLTAELLGRGPWPAACALIAAHAAGRAQAVAMMYALPYAGDEGRARTRSFAREVRGVDAGWATAVGALFLALAAAMQQMPVIAGGMSLALFVVLFLGLRDWLRRRLDGYTGDTLGAAEQLGELTALLAMAAAWPR